MSKQRLDMNNRNHQLIVASLANMVENEGLTAHEAFEVLEDIKRQTWHALADIQRETKGVAK